MREHLGDVTSCSSSSLVGMASAQARREATIAPAAFAYSAIRMGSQPDSRPCTRVPPKASPAPRPQTTSTGCGGTTALPFSVATRTPSPPIFTMASSTPWSSRRVAASCGIGGADRDLDLRAVADDHGREVKQLVVLRAGVARRGPEHRSPVEVDAGPPARAGLRPAARGEHLKMSGARRLYAHAGAGHPQHRHVLDHVRTGRRWGRASGRARPGSR